MKHTNKFMIVPYINNATNPNDPIEKYLISLDEEMTTILNRKDISPQEKLSLYNQALTKYLAYSQDDNIHNRITARSNDQDKFSINLKLNKKYMMILKKK